MSRWSIGLLLASLVLMSASYLALGRIERDLLRREGGFRKEQHHLRQGCPAPDVEPIDFGYAFRGVSEEDANCILAVRWTTAGDGEPWERRFPLLRELAGRGTSGIPVGGRIGCGASGSRMDWLTVDADHALEVDIRLEVRWHRSDGASSSVEQSLKVPWLGVTKKKLGENGWIEGTLSRK